MHDKPVERKQGSFDAAQLPKSKIEFVLTAIGRVLAKHERWRNGAFADRSRKADQIIPFRLDRANLDGLAAWNETLYQYLCATARAFWVARR